MVKMIDECMNAEMIDSSKLMVNILCYLWPRNWVSLLVKYLTSKELIYYIIYYISGRDSVSTRNKTSANQTVMKAHSSGL